MADPRFTLLLINVPPRRHGMALLSVVYLGHGTGHRVAPSFFLNVNFSARYHSGREYKERLEININTKRSLYFSLSVCAQKGYHSGRKYKDRLVLILMYRRSLYSRPEWYSLTVILYNRPADPGTISAINTRT